MERVVTMKELEQMAENFAAKLAPRETAATVIALYGDLGTGKTTFTQHLARALAVKSPVTSPTFVIEKVYSLENQAFERLVHIDAYRIEESREMQVLGWDALIAEPSTLVVVEWADRIEDLLPEGTMRIRLFWESEHVRRVVYEEE